MQHKQENLVANGTIFVNGRPYISSDWPTLENKSLTLSRVP